MKPHRFFALLLALSAALPASCAPARPSIQSTPALEPTPTPVAATPTAEAPTTAADIPLNCQDLAKVDAGSFRAENNTWGKGTLTGWSQCIGLQPNADETVAARWTWDWPNSGSNVKAYPEIIFGQKPGTTSTTDALPRQVDGLREVRIKYDVASTHTGSGNLAFDFWLTNTDNPTAWGVPPITTEIMIWLESYGSMAPGGSWKEKTTIGGTPYSVYTAKNWGDGWDYVAFFRTKPQTGAGELDLVDFLTYMKTVGLITGEEYLASVEFGNEVAGGSGETSLKALSVTIR